MPSLKDKAAIVGVAETPYARSLPESEWELACRAIVDACTDAGISPAEIDGMVSYTQETSDEVAVAKAIGASDLTFFSNVGYGGGGAASAVGLLALGVATGQCRVGVAWRSRKRGSGGRPWQGAGVGSGLALATDEFVQPYGLLRPVDAVAALTRRYMFEYGASREDLANVALACRRHANLNPRAVMFGRTLTLDEYLDSRWISEPLCLFDNCLETDGAAAVVVTAVEMAKDLKQVPVLVHSYSQGLPAQHHTMADFFGEDPVRHNPAAACARGLFARSDFSATEIPVAQLYDAFTPMVWFALEGFGFCKQGEAGEFTRQKNVEIGGSLPINTAGGGLSEGYIHGFNLVNEGVRQIRGTSTCQVEAAESCLVSSASTVPTSAVILRK